MDDVPVFFPSCSPRNQTASLSGSYPSLSSDTQKTDLAPVPNHGYLLKAFLVSSFNKGFWGIWVSVPTTLIKPVHTYDTLAKIMANLKYGHNWNQTMNVFDTQTIYLFILFFFLDVNVVTSCESCGRKAAMCCVHQRQKFARGRLAVEGCVVSLQGKHTHKKNPTKKCYTTSHFQKTNKKEKNLNQMQAADVCRWQIGIFWSRGFLMETCADTLTISQCLPLILFLKCPSFLNNYQTTNSVVCQNLQFHWYMLWYMPYCHCQRTQHQSR